MISCSHFSQDGDKPWYRYFRHGCIDYIDENIYALDANVGGKAR